MTYKVISLFSGTGGSSLGYKLAGLKVLLSNEFVEAAWKCYEANFPDTICLHDDIRKLTGDIILSKVGLKKGELDVLDGSPPCASFSTAGKREKKWGTITTYSDVEQRVDDLLFEYARILGEIQPKVFLVENVKGLVMGEAKRVFDEAKKEFESKGYNVSSRLLNAKYFRVPQNRPRIIFIGVRKDLGVQPSHPKPQHAPIPIKEVLKDVVNSPQDIEDSKYPEHYSVMKYLKQMKPGESGAKYNPKGSYFGLIRLDWDKPANTVLQSDAKHISCSAIHPEEHRKLTIPELRRISSFPDDFKLLGDYKQNWERIGRAVPPNMMRAIAEHIRYRILDKINNIKNDYNPPYYDEEAETTGQIQFNFGDEFRKGFKQYK